MLPAAINNSERAHSLRSLWLMGKRVTKRPKQSFTLLSVHSTAMPEGGVGVMIIILREQSNTNVVSALLKHRMVVE